MLAAAASAWASLRLVITTCAPAPASAFAVSSPSPPLAPVTTATRPAWSGMSAVVQLMAIDRIVQGVPEITLDANLFGTAFVTVLVIMDPIGNIPIFLSLTRGQSAAQRHRSALLASTVAGAVILAFALGGQQVLHLLGISIEALQVAGGLLLLIIALELLLPAGGAHTLRSEARRVGKECVRTCISRWSP